ncbi:MAG: endonuclease/exonuclease/phosphatase family protein, partial [Myxococcales bacterium]|nr:endonuclease/exonuclease/phosphatase family protein [Myxococcales bacterium]
ERPTAGALGAELQAGSAQARAVAQIIQTVRPDVLVLQEFDYDPAALARFQAAYLAVGQGGAAPIDYPYAQAFPSNTGQPSGLDLDRDGATDGPGDAWGFGRHPGQYAFAVLSRFPLGPARTFQRFKWAALPGARLPKTADGPWYSPQALAGLPLSSKNHVDLTVALPGGPAHLLIAHPTPPVFDGPEDRNGLRNFDEIGFWARYLTPAASGALVDDVGQAGGLAKGERFIVLGDQNADPLDGDSQPGAIAQLLNHPRVHPAVVDGAHVPTSPGGAARAKAEGRRGDPARHTAGWGLRVDYVLPSKDFQVRGAGVFWPAPEDPAAALVGEVPPSEPGGRARPVSSDHRLVWVDVD